MDPRRRRLCRSLAALPLASLAGCLSGLPRATGPRNPPDETRSPTGGASGSGDVVSVSSTTVEESEDGRLLVTGEVRNLSDARAVRTVVVEATVDGDEYSGSTEVTVPGDGTATFSVVVPVEYGRFNDGGSLDVGLA
jgi:hypothetical protein